MYRIIVVIAAAALIPLYSATPLAAQDHAVVISAHGGGYTPLTDLNNAGTADFETGFDVGGGVGIQVHRYVTIRGDFTFARSEGRGSSGVAGVDFNKFFYGGDVQLRYPFASGVAPYVFAGGGAVTIDPQGGTGSSFTKGAGRFGAGVSYSIPRSNFGLFAEGTGWVYKFDQSGFDKTQVDVTYSGGISYRFGF